MDDLEDAHQIIRPLSFSTFEAETQLWSYALVDYRESQARTALDSELVCERKRPDPGNPVIGTVNLPYMARVRGNVIIQGNPDMAGIALPSMTAIGGGFWVSADHLEFLELIYQALEYFGRDVIFEGDVSSEFNSNMTINGSLILSYSDSAGNAAPRLQEGTGAWNWERLNFAVEVEAREE
ncbi:hypothetical protein MPH_01918 [Macrophomina phaseolina MS6]|uniref:Uncharacterized protein n=1 Tax=Macrophomina phaseolina (strain MS6) TaxID=1126212 RepID=K2RDY9_MACPH|nr:hypothetical protein MPH_01918 [Macrophomina phaseolina MS6]